MSINIHYYTYCIDDSILFLSMVTFFRSKVIVCSICTIQKSLINFDYQTCELIVNANDSMIQIKIFFILQCTKILWTLLLIFETKLLRWIYFPDLSVCWFMLSGLTEFESFLHEEWRWFGRWFRWWFGWWWQEAEDLWGRDSDHPRKHLEWFLPLVREEMALVCIQAGVSGNHLFCSQKILLGVHPLATHRI